MFDTLPINVPLVMDKYMLELIFKGDPFSIKADAPFSIPIIAIVDRKVGIFNFVATTPLLKPMRLPVRIPTNIDAQPRKGQANAAIVPENGSLAPTETSMLPMIRSIDIPIEAMSRTAICLSRLFKLAAERKVWY